MQNAQTAITIPFDFSHFWHLKILSLSTYPKFKYNKYIMRKAKSLKASSAKLLLTYYKFLNFSSSDFSSVIPQ